MIVAKPVRLVATDDDEPPAELFDKGGQRLRLLGLRAVDVHQHHCVVGEELSFRRYRAASLDFDAARGKRSDQSVRLTFDPFDDGHLGRTQDPGDAFGAIVLGSGVEAGLDGRRYGEKARARPLDLNVDLVASGDQLDIDGLLLVATLDRDSGASGLVRTDHNRRFDIVAFSDDRGQLHTFHQGIGAPGRVESNNVDRDASFGETPGRRASIAGRRNEVGEQDDPPGALARHNCRDCVEGRGEVSRRVVRVGPDRSQLAIKDERRVELGIAAEDSDCSAFVSPGFREHAVEKAFLVGRGCSRYRGRPVQEKEHGALVDRPRQDRLRGRQHEGSHGNQPDHDGPECWRRGTVLPPRRAISQMRPSAGASARSHQGLVNVTRSQPCLWPGRVAGGQPTIRSPSRGERGQ